MLYSDGYQIGMATGNGKINSNRRKERMNKKLAIQKTISLLTFCLLSLIFITSISSAEEPKYGGTLRIGVFIPQDRLDVRDLTIAGFVPSASMIYDPLFGWGEKGFESLIPALATEYETDDYKTWIFHLRKGVKFHNGREMTAKDVKTNLDWRITTPPGWKPVNNRQLIKGLNKVEIIDDYTIKFSLIEPQSTFVSFF